MLSKVSRQKCLNDYPVFPLRSYDYKTDEEEFFYPQVFKSYILTLSSKSYNGHIKVLGTELTRWTKELDSDSLIFLGDVELAWLNQENDYKPAKEAQEYLIHNNIGKRFNGAIRVSIPELPTFIRHLSWLTRCNAALPYFYFTDTGKNIMGHICQYGNLHLDTLNEKTDKQLRSFMATSKLKYLAGSRCYNQFGITSAIAGRRTIL